ncbi:hypothetical protein BH23GEM9_BH23GEM9_01830 [soil metagenome]
MRTANCPRQPCRSGIGYAPFAIPLCRSRRRGRMTDPSRSDSLSRVRSSLAGRYHVDRALGVGGMATVYLAADSRHHREVAIKVLHTDVAGSLAHDRFNREIQLAAGLTHPHILPLYDSGEADGIVFFVMPVMRGHTLRERLGDVGAMPIDFVVRFAADVADALDYAHRHGVVHRDIKPENILLHEGHAIVADFGIGKALAAARDTSELTQVGVMIGTPAYMSPEQAAGDELDGRSDLFSLGCVLHESLTGEPAFSGPSTAAVIARRFIHTPPDVRVSRPDAPAWLAGLVARLLAREADARPATAAEVVSLMRASSTLQPHQAPPVPAAVTSIAVLPFVNLSADAENSYFSDGLTEEITTDLSRIHALRVTARASSMQHEASTRAPREIGAALGVRYLLTGSVRRAGPALRIAAQLIDAAEDHLLWGDKFSGTIDEVFDLQERVSREIVAALGITLNAEEDRRLGARGLTHASAYELYLQARAGIRRMSMPSGQLVDLIDRAVAIEGDVPTLRGLRLWAEVSKLKVGIGDRTRMGDIEEQARHLVALAPDGPWGYAALGYLHMERGDMAQSIIWFRRAIDRDPSDADSRFWLIAALAYAGMLSESADAAEELLALDPASPQAWLIGTTVDVFSGNAAETIVPIERALVANASDFFAHWDLAYVRCLLGDLDAAQPHVDWLHDVQPDIPYVVQAKALLEALRGDGGGALAPLARMDLAAYDAHLTFHFAELFAMTGDIERGLDVLTLAVEKGFTPVEFIALHCPFIEPLRAHPRFAGIVEDARRRSGEVRRAVSS